MRVGQMGVRILQKIRIMIAGIRRTSFQALVRMLGRASEAYEVLEPAWGEAEALKLLREINVDIALVDASAAEGFDLCRAMNEAFPDICIILVGGRHNYDWLKCGMDAGARGYIAEDNCTGEGMRAEISRVLRMQKNPARAADPIVESVQISGSRAVTRAMDFVRQNYRRNISVAEAAEYAGISESHLRRCFRQETGMSFVDYLTKFRVDSAKALMEKGDVPVHLVSEETGFSSARYFCRVFKKATNHTPREYMQQRKTGEKQQ